MISIENIGEVCGFRLARGILGRAMYYTAAYWVDGLMIDTGCFYTVTELVSALEKLNVDRVVSTHSHEDHIGANAALTKKFGAGILAHPLAIPVLAISRDQKHLNPYQVVMWGYPEPSFAVPIPDTIQTAHHHFNVIHTPGHTGGSICLLGQNEIFTGDTLFADSIGRVDFPESSPQQMQTSLAKLSLLPDRLTTYPGHGPSTSIGREKAHNPFLLRPGS